MRNEKRETRNEKWGQNYELKEKYFFIDLLNLYIKWIITGLIGKKACKKQKKNILKKKPAEYYKQNKEAIKEKSRGCCMYVCIKDKKTRWKSTKKENTKNQFSLKKKY